MRYDCPYCEGNMNQKFVRWTEIGHYDRSRNCPLCGGDIIWKFYREEIVTRVLTFVILLVAFYLINSKRGSVLLILLAASVAIVGGYLFTRHRLKDAQRYEKNVELEAMRAKARQREEDDE
jgi:hypothetical protein